MLPALRQSGAAMYKETIDIEVGSRIPARLKQLWIWFEAIYEWDWGDPGLLAAVIKEEQIPPEFQIAVADIVEGIRPRPNYKNSAVSAEERLWLATFSSQLAEVRVEFLRDREGVQRMSDEARKERIEVIRDTQKAIRISIDSLLSSNFNTTRRL